MKPDLIIFDCDGVLIDSELIACSVDAEELSRLGYAITPEEVVRRYAGVPAAEMYAEIEAHLGHALPEDFAATVERRVLTAYRQDLRPIVHAADTIRRLSWRSCVASSSKPSKLGLGLIETGLFELFYPHIFSATLVPRGKPAPDLFLLAAERMDAEPHRCLVIEDSVAGVTAARAARMPVLGFVGGSHCTAEHGQTLRAAGAELIFDSFELLPALVRDLAERRLSVGTAAS